MNYISRVGLIIYNVVFLSIHQLLFRCNLTGSRFDRILSEINYYSFPLFFFCFLDFPFNWIISSFLSLTKCRLISR